MSQSYPLFWNDEFHAGVPSIASGEGCTGTFLQVQYPILLLTFSRLHISHQTLNSTEPEIFSALMVKNIGFATRCSLGSNPESTSWWLTYISFDHEIFICIAEILSSEFIVGPWTFSSPLQHVAHPLPIWSNQEGPMFYILTCPLMSTYSQTLLVLPPKHFLNLFFHLHCHLCVNENYYFPICYLQIFCPLLSSTFYYI